MTENKYFCTQFGVMQGIHTNGRNTQDKTR